MCQRRENLLGDEESKVLGVVLLGVVCLGHNHALRSNGVDPGEA